MQSERARKRPKTEDSVLHPQYVVEPVDEGRSVDLVQNLNKSPPPSLCISNEVDDTILKSLVWPMSTDQFLDDYYKTRAVVLPPDASSNRLDDLISSHLFDLDLEQMLGATASENIHVWMRVRENTDSESLAQVKSFQTPDHEAALTCHQAGASLYFRSSEQMAQIYIKALGKALGCNFAMQYPDGGLRGEIETFISRAGHVTDWHFDYMENFTVQLSGRKRWHLHQSQIKAPLRGCTPHFAGIDTAELQMKLHRLQNPEFLMPFTQTGAKAMFAEHETVELTAGSVMYFPAGMWHKVECTEDSVSINFSLMPQSWADFVSDSIKHLLLRDARWCSSINFRDKEDVKSQLTSLLEDLKAKIDLLNPSDMICDAMADNGEQLQKWVAEAKLADPEEAEDSGDDHDEGFANPNGVFDVENLSNDPVPLECMLQGNPLATVLPDSVFMPRSSEDSHARFAVHFNCGSSDFVSYGQATLRMPTSWSPFMKHLQELCLKNAPFPLSLALEHSGDDLRPLQARQLLQLLSYLGYLRITLPQPTTSE